MRVLITGMSASGKSTVIRELRRRGYDAYDADDDGFTESGDDGAWRWRTDTIAALFAASDSDLLFFAGCSDEQREFEWHCTVLLTAPEPVIVTRLRTRATNSFGKTASEQAKVLEDMRAVEPLLRRGADAVIDSTQPLPRVVDLVVAAAGRGDPTHDR